MLPTYFTKNSENLYIFDDVMDKIWWLNFLTHSVFRHRQL